MKTKLLTLTTFIMVSIVSSCNEKSKTLGSDKTVYSCTMHHQVRENKSGPCPVCGMDLVVVADLNDW